jgi:hypothetical protein
MRRTWKPLGRTEALVPPLEQPERALAQGKGPGEPGINWFRRNGSVFLFTFLLVCF